MTFKEMQDSVLESRFNEGLRYESGLWLNQRLSLVWAVADWPWKKSGDLETFPVVDGLVTVPPTMRRPLYVQAAGGGEIKWADPIEFHRGASGYTMLDDTTMRVSGGVSSIEMRYEKKLYHWDFYGADIVGGMDDDNDTPPWDPDYHYFLVQGAISTGLKRENDPTFTALDEDYNAGIIVMREEFLPPNNPENRQYGSLAWS